MTGVIRRSLTLAALAALIGTATSFAANAPGKLALRSTSLGKLVVDGRGRTLYLYTSDRSRTSTCYGACAASWPPFLTSAKPLAGLGLEASLVSISKRKDGRMQVVYAGHPLYFFAHDTGAGQLKGEGMGGTWFAVSATGAKIRPPAGGGTVTTPDPGAGYGGGGY